MIYVDAERMLGRPFGPLRRRSAMLLATALLSTAPALAQTPDQLAHARTDFREGLALETAGDWAGALAKFRAVANVKMTPQVRFNIAVCEEHLGKLVAALGDFQLAQDEALDQKAQDLAAKADEHAKAVAARIPKLTIARGSGAEAASIALDGVTLGATVLGTEMKLDPGPHTVAASVGGEQKFSKTVQLAEGESQQVEVVIAAVAAPPKVASTATQPEAPSPTPEPPEGGGGSHTTGWILVGAGGASAVAGVVFLVLRGGTISDLDAACRDGHCPASSQSTADKGKLYTGLAEATLVAGAAGLTIGTIMLLGNDSSSTPATTGSTRHPTLALQTGAPGAIAGASLSGRF